MNNLARTVVYLLFALFLLPLTIIAQKTVRVREYQRKDGTVVRTHTRRAPGSSRSTSTAPTSGPLVGFKDGIFVPSPLDELSELVLEPYATVDLGDGSFYTPGGTGVSRPRRATQQQR